MKIAILGGGSWGTALALHLAQKSIDITMWEFFQEQAEEMQKQRFCRLLPGVKLPGNIAVSHKIEEVLLETDLVLIVVPSDKVEATIGKAQFLLKDQPVVICSKGLASGLRLLSEAVQEKVKGEVYCLYGPTHAEEVCQGLFSGIVLCGKNKDGLQKWQKVLEGPQFKVHLSEDIVGVQVCAALKNILAVFVGVLDGAGLGDNAKAYVMTKGLEEIQQVGLKWGAKKETFYGLAGMGDMIVTCSSKHSRNRFVGEQIGKGRKLEEVLAEMKMVAEGITTVKEAIKLKEKFGLELPLITGLYDILFNGKNVEAVLEKI